MKKKQILNPKLPRRYGQLTAEELDKEVQVFDREFIMDSAVPLTAAERAQDQRARRKRGRPTVGKGAARVLISLESDLLKRSDAYARKKGLSRSALIALGLEAILRHGA